MDTPTTAVANPYEPPHANPEVVARPAAPYRSGSDLGSMTHRMIEELQGTRPWVRLIAGFTFFSAIAMGLVAVALFFSGSELAGPAAKIAAPVGLLYVVAAICYWILASHLWSYSSSITELVSSRRVLAMEKALADQRRFWAFAGKLTLLLVVLTVVLLAVSIPFT
jgi:hypothetical protein